MKSADGWRAVVTNEDRFVVGRSSHEQVEVRLAMRLWRGRE